MNDAFPRGRTAIVGAATFGVGTTPGYSNFDLAAHASVKALAQGGLKPSDVDGLFCVVMDEALSGLNFAEYLGIRTRFNDNNRTGGSSFQIQATVAALALAAGQCDVALIAYGSNQRSCERQAAVELAVVAVGDAVQAAAADLVVRAGRRASHARVRHDQAATRRGRDRRAPVGAAQSRGLRCATS